MIKRVGYGLFFFILCAGIFACKGKTAMGTLADYDAALHKRIRKVVDDDEKRDKLELLHAQSRLRQMDLTLIFAESGVKLRNTPDMTRDEATALLTESAEKRAKTLRDVATIRLEMRTLVSEDEWNQLYQGNPVVAAPKEKE